MIVGVDGLGSVGLRAARELVETPGVQVVLRSSRPERLDQALEAFGERARRWADDVAAPSVVVLAGSSGGHAAAARAHVLAGRSVVSTSDDLAEVRSLLALDDEARAAGVSVSVGVAFSPGLSCLLARLAADSLERVDLVRVAMTGAGGPECLEHRRVLHGGTGPEWVDGAWSDEPPGPSGELVWFPDPVGPTDCERGALSEPVVLQRAFPGATSIAARSSVPRIPRFAFGQRGTRTEPLGALRVEVSGQRAGADETVVYAVVDRPSLAAGTLAAVVATAAPTPAGAGGLAERPYARPILAELARRGVKAAVYDPLG